MKHITDEDVEVLRNLVPAFRTARHLMILAGNTEEAERFEGDARALENVIAGIS